MRKVGCDIAIPTTKWFICLFIDILPTEVRQISIVTIKLLVKNKHFVVIRTKLLLSNVTDGEL